MNYLTNVKLPKCDSLIYDSQLQYILPVVSYNLYLLSSLYPLKVQACCPGHTPQVSELSV